MRRQLERLPWHSALRVTIAEFKENRQLSCGYDEQGGLLYLTTPRTEPSPLGINIDNGILLDLDSSRELIFVECIMRFCLWPDASLTLPRGHKALGRLVFGVPRRANTVFTEIEFVKLVADRVKCIGLIQWGVPDFTTIIKVGPECYAYLFESLLVGFIFRLAPQLRPARTLQQKCMRGRA